jgi:hypothetical protein
MAAGVQAHGGAGHPAGPAPAWRTWRPVCVLWILLAFQATAAETTIAKMATMSPATDMAAIFAPWIGTAPFD